MQYEKLVVLFGKGLITGLGIGAVSFGLLFLSISFGQNDTVNASALLAIFSGIALLFLNFTKQSNVD